MPPTPLNPSPQFAYLIGIIAGDGCIYKYERTCELTIACDDRYPDLIMCYSMLVGSLIPGKVRVEHAKQRKYTMIRVCNTHLPILLGLPHGPKTSNGFAIPEWVFTSRDYIKPFVRGLIETDGGVYKIHRGVACNWHCHFTAKIETIMTAFLRGTRLLGYRFNRKGYKARLSVTEQVKSLVETLEITKIREYTY